MAVLVLLFHVLNALFYLSFNSFLQMMMEYMEGGTLDDAMVNHKFAEPEIAYVAREVKLSNFVRMVAN